jgi:hypothetical protein
MAAALTFQALFAAILARDIGNWFRHSLDSSIASIWADGAGTGSRSPRRDVCRKFRRTFRRGTSASSRKYSRQSRRIEPMSLSADSDFIRLGIPMRSRPRQRDKAGHHSDLKPATLDERMTAIPGASVDAFDRRFGVGLADVAFSALAHGTGVRSVRNHRIRAYGSHTRRAPWTCGSAPKRQRRPGEAQNDFRRVGVRQ